LLAAKDPEFSDHPILTGKIKLDDPIFNDSRLNFEMVLIERGILSTL